MRMLFDTVGADNIALVSDAMAAAGMPDGGYALGGLDVTVRDGTARLTEGGSIAGGTATLLDVVRRIVAAGVPLPDAVTAATTTPASALGLPASRLVPGGPADVVVVDDTLALASLL
jgi:N-acetylglucosamine-6-phosphate deacetylase